MQHSKIRMKTLVSITFAFLLTLLFLALYLSLGFWFGVFNDGSVISKLNESNYYSKVHSKINLDAEKIVTKAGFPATILQGVITRDRVYVSSRNDIMNALKSRKSQINTNRIQKSLNDNIDKYLSEQNILRTAKIDQGINALVLKIDNEYASDIRLPFVSLFTDYKADFITLMRIMIPTSILLAGVLCFFLIKMHRYKHRGLRYITYALIASSCVTLFGAAYLLISDCYVKADITPAYYRDFINSYLRWDIMVFLYMAVIGLILSLGLISLTGYMRNKIMNS